MSWEQQTIRSERGFLNVGIAPKGFAKPFPLSPAVLSLLLLQPLECICSQKFTLSDSPLTLSFPSFKIPVFPLSREIIIWSFLTLFMVRLLKYLFGSFMCKSSLRRVPRISTDLGVWFGSSSCLVNQFLLISSWWAWLSIFHQQVNGILLIWVEPGQISKLTFNPQDPAQWDTTGKVTSLFKPNPLSNTFFPFSECSPPYKSYFNVFLSVLCSSLVLKLRKQTFF